MPIFFPKTSSYEGTSSKVVEVFARVVLKNPVCSDDALVVTVGNLSLTSLLLVSTNI